MTTSSSHLIPPHGGELIDLIAQPEAANELKARSREWPSWDLTARQLCDLELLLSGGFSPLRGFMTRADYEGVCHNMRLASGLLWPMPITLDVSEEFAKTLKPGSSKVALRDPEGVMLARPARGGSLAARPQSRSPGGIQQHQQGASRRGLCDEQGQPLVCRWPRGGHAGAVALRLPLPAPHSSRASRRVRAPGLAADRRFPDAQSHASRPSGTHLPRRQTGGSQPSDPPSRGHDQARRRGLFHPRALLSVADFQVSAGDGETFPAAVGHAHGRTARGHLARVDSQESRLQPFHRGPRSRRPRQGHRRQALLWSLRGPGGVQEASSRHRRHHGSLQHDGLPRRPGQIFSRRRSSQRCSRAQHLGHGAAPAAE